MISKEMENIIKLIKDFSSKMELTVEAQRAGIEQLGSMTKLAKDVKYEAVDAGGVAAEWITTPDIINHHIILDLHGGYYIMTTLEIERLFAAEISRSTKCRVLAIDYRLAPEHPYPAALDDAVKAYRWLIKNQGIDPKNLIIEGLSVGDGLTLACLLKLRDEGDPLPVAAVSLWPYGDLTLSGESYKKNADLDWISYESSKFNAPLYYGGEDPRNPYISPIFGDFKGLPPLLIQTGTSEVLYDDAILLAECAKAAGVDLTLDVWEDMIHGFQIFPAFAPESREALKKIGEFVNKYLE
ncbi:MAG: alpha/beta hydrolase [Promethearchaeota archaeon]